MAADNQVAVRMPSSADILKEIGDESVLDALALKTFTDPIDGPPSREAILLGYLHDATLADAGLPVLMKKAGLLLPEMLDLIRKKDIAIAMTASGKHIGEVLDGIGEFAKPRFVICRKCDGEGEVEDKESVVGDPDAGESEIGGTKQCPNPECKDGKVRQMGNLEAAKLFLEAQGLKNRGGGNTQINVGTQVGVRVDGQSAGKSQQESVTSRVQAALES